MIDVFVVIIMSTVVRMSGLLTISPGIAIVFFSFTVLLTMLAAEEYDERLLWDHALSTRSHTLLDEEGRVINDDKDSDAILNPNAKELLVKNYERLKGSVAKQDSEHPTEE